MSKIQAIRGMNDILPDDSPVWQYVEKITEQVVQSYGYREIRFPVLEQTQLFKRSIGEVTDIVEKEMYSFSDRNGDDLSLRPEGTAGCVRAAEQHGLLYNQQQRLWYRGPMFRHERPQKGRYRQFHQVGLEAFGMAGPDIDAEVILVSVALWRALGLTDSVRLEINNIGTADDRKAFGAALTEFLLKHEAHLDEDSQRRLHTNPLRVLDSKVPATRAILADAPCLADFTGAQTVEHYQALKQLLAGNGVAFVENPNLVRGLDYYNNMVFEWITDDLGAQGTVCAGGLAFGMERLILLLESMGKVPAAVRQTVDVYLLISDNSLQAEALTLAEWIRAEVPDIRIVVHCGGGKFNNQLKKAYNSGAKVAVIVDSANDGKPGLRYRQLDDEGVTQDGDRAGLLKALSSLKAQLS